MIWAAYFGAALGCQLAASDNFPITFFAFPVNAALLLPGAVLLWMLHKKKPTSLLAGLLASPATTFLLLAVSIATFVALEFIAWLRPDSWWFFFVFSALSAHLLFITFRGLKKRKKHRLRFLLNHAGLLLILAGGFAGSADTAQYRLRVFKEESTQQAFAPDGRNLRLPQAFRLERFDATYYSNGMPKNYEAHLKVGTENVLLRVNHPYRLSWTENLYLIDYEHRPEGEEAGHCTVEIVRQPWKPVQWTGIWMLMAGSLLLFVQGLSASKKGAETT